LRCRGALPEAATYGAALALWQRRLLEQADALIVPSGFARARLRTLGAPLPWERVHVLAPPVRALAGLASPPRSKTAASESESMAARARRRPYALVVARLAPEKGVDVAIAACRLAGIALAVAGDGPELPALRELAGDGDVRFAGRVDDLELARLRAGASVALVPSRSAETFGMAAAEAMAAGLPVAASRVGALPELLEDASLAPPGDAFALAGAIARVLADPDIGRRGRERVAAVCAPDVVARGLADVYGGVATARAET
jgi:glycosyltransferase involved in cell wall biosynthesis